MISLLYIAFCAALGLLICGSVLYLLILLAAASRRPSCLPANASHPLRLTVLVPAHDEELVLAQTLDSLAAQAYPAALYDVLVIADNCADSTADIARARGATVWERINPDARGKGHALNWAIPLLLASPRPADAFIIIDADTFAAPDFLRVLAARLRQDTNADGFCALQGRYGVLNTDEGWRAALMSAAFDLVNHVRPLGRDRMGLSAGLKGNGMAFTRAVLAQVQWRGDSLTEDLDFALDIARGHGLRVGYVPEARVWAQMPTSGAQAASQRRRWEDGRLASVRRRAGPLLREGIIKRQPLLVDAALDLLLPPLAQFAALTFAWLGAVAFGIAQHWLPCPAAWAGGGAFAVLGLALYVLGGLRVSGASRAAYLALLRAPFYGVWKLALMVTGRRGKSAAANAPPEWVRTARTPVSSASSPTSTVPSTEARVP